MTHTLSSTAQRCYWLGRYLERAENSARLVNVNGRLLFDLPKRLPLGWQPLVEITGNQQLFAELYDESSEKNVSRFLINDLRNPGSLMSSISMARENVRTLRGIIPRQSVEYINEMYLYAKDQLSEPLSRSRRTQGLIEVAKFTQRLEGFMSGNMLHDANWSFFRLGNYIERADMTSRIIDVGLDNMLADISDLEPFADIQWRSVLLSLDAAQSYNTEVQEPVSQDGVLNFLVRNDRLPRSLTYSLDSIRHGLRALPRHEQSLKLVNRLRRTLKAIEFSDAEQIRQFLDDVQVALAELDQAISRTYFQVRPSPGRSRESSPEPSPRNKKEAAKKKTATAKKRTAKKRSVQNQTSSSTREAKR